MVSLVTRPDLTMVVCSSFALLTYIGVTREATEPFIGEAGTPQHFNSMQTVIESGLSDYEDGWRYCRLSLYHPC